MTRLDFYLCYEEPVSSMGPIKLCQARVQGYIDLQSVWQWRMSGSVVLKSQISRQVMLPQLPMSKQVIV